MKSPEEILDPDLLELYHEQDAIIWDRIVEIQQLRLLRDILKEVRKHGDQ